MSLNSKYFEIEKDKYNSPQLQFTFRECLIRPQLELAAKLYNNIEFTGTSYPLNSFKAFNDIVIDLSRYNLTNNFSISVQPNWAITDLYSITELNISGRSWDSIFENPMPDQTKLQLETWRDEGLSVQEVLILYNNKSNIDTNTSIATGNINSIIQNNKIEIFTSVFDTDFPITDQSIEIENLTPQEDIGTSEMAPPLIRNYGAESTNPDEFDGNIHSPFKTPEGLVDPYESFWEGGYYQGNPKSGGNAACFFSGKVAGGSCKPMIQSYRTLNLQKRKYSFKMSSVADAKRYTSETPTQIEIPGGGGYKLVPDGYIMPYLNMGYYLLKFTFPEIYQKNFYRGRIIPSTVKGVQLKFIAINETESGTITTNNVPVGIREPNRANLHEREPMTLVVEKKYYGLNAEPRYVSFIPRNFYIVPYDTTSVRIVYHDPMTIPDAQKDNYIDAMNELCLTIDVDEEKFAQDIMDYIVSGDDSLIKAYLKPCLDSHDSTGQIIDNIQRFEISDGKIKIPGKDLCLKIQNEWEYKCGDPLCFSEKQTALGRNIGFSKDCSSTNARWGIPSPVGSSGYEQPLYGFRKKSSTQVFCSYDTEQFKSFDQLKYFESQISNDPTAINKIASSICVKKNDSLQYPTCVKYFTQATPLTTQEQQNLRPQCLTVPVNVALNPTDDVRVKKGIFKHGACINYYKQQINNNALTTEEKQSIVDRCLQLEDPTSEEICRMICKKNEVCTHLTKYCEANVKKCGDLVFAPQYKLHEKVLKEACNFKNYSDPIPLPVIGQIKIILYDKTDQAYEYTNFTTNTAEGFNYILFTLGQTIDIKRIEIQTSVNLYQKVVSILDSLNMNLPRKFSFRIERGTYDVYDHLLFTLEKSILGSFIRIDIQRPHNRNIFTSTCGQYVNMTKSLGIIEKDLNQTITDECKHMREHGMGNTAYFSECACFQSAETLTKLKDGYRNKTQNLAADTRLECIYEPCVSQEIYKNQTTNCPNVVVCTNDISITNQGIIEGDFNIRLSNDCARANDGTNGGNFNNIDCITSEWSSCKYTIDTNTGKPIDGIQTRNVLVPKQGEGTGCGPLERQCPEFTTLSSPPSDENASAGKATGIFTPTNAVIGGAALLLLVGGILLFSKKSTSNPKTN